MVEGKIPQGNDPDYTDKQARRWVIASKVSTGLLLGAAIGLVVALPALILYPILAGRVAAGGAALLVILMVLYFLGLRFIVTRV